MTQSKPQGDLETTIWYNSHAFWAVMNRLQVAPAAWSPCISGRSLSGNSIIEKPVELYLQLTAGRTYKQVQLSSAGTITLRWRSQL